VGVIVLSSKEVYERLQDKKEFVGVKVPSLIVTKHYRGTVLEKAERAFMGAVDKMASLTVGAEDWATLPRVKLDSFNELIDLYSDMVLERKHKGLIIESIDGKELAQGYLLKVHYSADVECIRELASGALEYRFLGLDHLKLDTFVTTVGKDKIKVKNKMWMFFKTFNYLTGGFTRPLSGVAYPLNT